MIIPPDQGRDIVLALIRGDRDTAEAIFDSIEGDRSDRLAAIAAAIYAEMSPAYLAASPDAKAAADGQVLAAEIETWLNE